MIYADVDSYILTFSNTDVRHRHRVDNIIYSVSVPYIGITKRRTGLENRVENRMEKWNTIEILV